MGQIVADLKAQPNYYTVPESPRDYVIHGSVSADNLRALDGLPYEVNITQSDQQLVLTTGDEWGAFNRNDRSTRQRDLTSRISFHTHPFAENTRMGVIFDAPSFGDLMMTIPRKRANLSPSIIAYRLGLTVYEFRAARSEDEGYELIEKFKTAERLPKQPDLRSLEYLQLLAKCHRKFALQTGSIVAEADWEEKNKVDEIMKLFRIAPKAQK